MRANVREMRPPSVRQGRVRAGRCASLERSARCADCPAMLGLAACRITRYVRFAHCAQTDAASQRWKRAARAAASPALLGAPEALRDLPERAFAPPVGVLAAKSRVSRQAVPVGGAVCGGEKRRAAVGAPLER